MKKYNLTIEMPPRLSGVGTGRYRYTRRTAWQRKRLFPIHKKGKARRQRIHYFTRFQDHGVITAMNGTTHTYGVLRWRLSDIPGYAEFTAMYDFFRITGVKVMFIPISNVTLDHDPATAAQTQFSNRIITAFDYNDGSVPTSANDLRQYSTCRVGPNNRIHKRFIRPQPLLVVDEDANTGSSVGLAQLHTWVSTASDTTSYYGIKYAIEHNDPLANLGIYRVEYKVYLKFKEPR